MKKCLFFIIYGFILIGSLSGQTNLVPNPGFETYTICPNFAGQVYYAPPWFQPNYTGGNVTVSCSSDLYNQCAPYGLTSVPINTYSGHQTPKSGVGYAGFVLRDIGTITSREYIETSLTTILLSGKMYCVNMYVSLADTSIYAISNIGAYFSNDSLLYSSAIGTNIPVSPQIENPSSNIVTDKDNWVLISGQFTAIGGEHYMTIGNFRDNASTPVQNVPGSYPYAYYYFDDISVVCCDCDSSSSIFIPNIFTPNNDGKNDDFKITSTGISSLSCKIYDRWGLLVAELKGVSDIWDGVTTAGIQGTEGVYYYVLSAKGTDDKEYNEKGFIQLVR